MMMRDDDDYTDEAQAGRGSIQQKGGKYEIRQRKKIKFASIIRGW